MVVSAVSPVKNSYPPKTKKTGGISKAIASTFVPGLGQLLDGRTVKGVGFLGAISFMAYGVVKNVKNLCKNLITTVSGNWKEYASNAVEGKKPKLSAKIIKALSKNMLVAAGLLVLGAVTHIACIIDAYRGNRNKN